MRSHTHVHTTPMNAKRRAEGCAALSIDRMVKEVAP